MLNKQHHSDADFSTSRSNSSNSLDNFSESPEIFMNDNDVDHITPYFKRRLIISKQPASEFYKDEGGKANFLTTELRLAHFDHLGKPLPLGNESLEVDIPLKVTLYFESGSPVEEADQDIFRFTGEEYDSILVKKETCVAKIQFRLEKVSRRKDGQRFKLRIEPNSEQCSIYVADIKEVYTNSICVLSKRKYIPGTEAYVNRMENQVMKLSKWDLQLFEDRILNKLGGVEAQITKMLHKIESQSAKIHSIECILGSIGLGNDLNDDISMALGVKTDNSDLSACDDGIIRRLLTCEDSHTLHLLHEQTNSQSNRKNYGNDCLQFNFGLPSDGNSF